MTVRPRDNPLPGNAQWFDSSLDLWSQHQITQTQARFGASLRALIVRLSLWQICLGVTVLGVFASSSIAFGVNILMHRPSPNFLLSMLMSAGIPALISPPVTWLAMRLLLETEAARRVAERMAVTDPLTSTFNRRHFFVVGERRFTQSKHLQQQLAVVLLDVDDFKAVNDQHGHAVGDRVLVDVAQACMACMRESDLLARYGGEEFVALLPATDWGHALQVAERVRASVAGLQVAVDGGALIRPTVSIGVAMLATTSVSFDSLLAQADVAMYSAKRSGKNRVVASVT